MTTAVSMYSRVGGGPAIKHVVDLALAALFLAHAPRDIVAAVEDTLSAVKPDIVVPA